MNTDPSHDQRKVLNVVPRIASGLSLCCATYMIWSILRSNYYRSRMYHRIMLGIAFNIILISGIAFWGSAASPIESDNLGANGNQATCTAQGFLHYFSSFITPLYYCVLSILCYVAVRKRFEYSGIIWLEKYIHCVVVLVPLSAACYILSVDGYNYIYIGCSFASIPTGCGYSLFGSEEELDEVCTRGPQNIANLQFFFVLVPILLLLLIPFAVMLLLCLRVSSQGKTPRDVTVSVIIQSAVYLLVLLAIYIFRIIDASLQFFGGEYVFATNLLANTNEALIGVWILFSYLYFRSDKKKRASKFYLDDARNDEHSSSHKITANVAEKSQITGHAKKEQEILSAGSSRGSSSSFFKKPEFSIFDGSDVTSDSPWAKFLSEGVDEDYEEGKIWQQ